VTAHAAFDKAAEYFKIKLRHVPVDSNSLKVDVAAVSRLINRNTIMVCTLSRLPQTPGVTAFQFCFKFFN
jgi:glutamate/tyrosine decarboxylase-like PLP-dependent enzyme